MQYNAKLPAAAVLGGASLVETHSAHESSTWSEGHNTHAWSSEQIEGVEAGGWRRVKEE